MKKFFKNIFIILVIIGNIGCRVKDEKTGYALEFGFLLTAPIWYPFISFNESIKNAKTSEYLTTPLKGIPGKTETTDYIDGNYVKIKILCDEKGYFQEQKAYYLNNILAYEAKYENGIPSSIKKYYDNGKLWRVYTKDGTISGRLVLEYDILGRVLTDYENRIDRIYYGDVLTYDSTGSILKQYYSTGAPKRISSSVASEEEKFYKEKEYLKDWEKITRIPSEKKEYNGRYTVYSPNKKLYADFNFKNGYRDGIQKQYYWNSDKLYSVENYKNGKKIGTHKYYYLNGKLNSIKEHIPEKNLVIEKVYGLSGKLNAIYEYDYKRGSENIGDRVKSTIYYSNGQVKSIIYKYSTGDKSYYMDGKLESIVVKEKYQGSEEKVYVKKWYYHDGKIRKVCVRFLTENSSNKRIHLQRVYYPNGVLNFEKKEYIDDSIVLEKYFDETGKLVKENKRKK